MAEKFLTTQKKKLIATTGLVISGWHVLTMGTNPLNLPAMPAVIINPIIGGFSLLTVAGIVTVLAVLMIWTEY